MVMTPYTATEALRSGEGSTELLQIPFREGETIGKGRIGVIQRIFLLRTKKDLDKKNDALPSFVYKRYHNQLTHESLETQHHAKLAIYSLLKKNTASQNYVVPTFRAAPEGWIMTDLTANGENLVFSKNENAPDGISRILKHPLAPLVSRIPPEYIAQQMEKIATAAAYAGVRISSDSIFFTLEAKGKPRFYIADLDNVFDARKENKEILQEKNNKSLESVIQWFTQIQAAIQSRLKN